MVSLLVILDRVIVRIQTNRRMRNARMPTQIQIQPQTTAQKDDPIVRIIKAGVEVETRGIEADPTMREEVEVEKGISLVKRP